MLIDFLKEYTKSAMLNYGKIKREGTGSLITDTMSMFSRKNEAVDSQQYFNLDKLWVLTFASTQVKQEIRDFAMAALIELIKMDECSFESKHRYVKLAVKNLAGQREFIRSSRLFKLIAIESDLKSKQTYEMLQELNIHF